MVTWSQRLKATAATKQGYSRLDLNVVSVNHGPQRPSNSPNSEKSMALTKVTLRYSTASVAVIVVAVTLTYVQGWPKPKPEPLPQLSPQALPQ